MEEEPPPPEEPFDFSPLSEHKEARPANNFPPNSKARRQASVHRVGRAPFVPTDGHRNLVRALRAAGATNYVIARLLKISIVTLNKHFKKELALGAEEVEAFIGGIAIQQAMQGNPEMVRFVLRFRYGWSGRADPNLPPPPETGDDEFDAEARLPPNLVIGFLEDESGPTIDGEVTETE